MFLGGPATQVGAALTEQDHGRVLVTASLAVRSPPVRRNRGGRASKRGSGTRRWRLRGREGSCFPARWSANVCQ